MSLILLNEQTNDGKILYLTDASTWNDGTIPAFATFQATMVSANITIKYKTPTNTSWSSIYTYDISSIITAATTVADLIYPITSVQIGLGSNLALPDGIYSIGYNLTDNVTTYSFASELELLLSNIIKAIVYKQVGAIAYKYYCANNYYTKPIDDVLLIKSLYDSMIASAYVAKQPEILNILEVLQRQTA